MFTNRELKKMVPQLLVTLIIGAVSWLFTSVQDLQSHLGACDQQVISLKERVVELDEELDMMEANFNDLLFAMTGNN